MIHPTRTLERDPLPPLSIRFYDATSTPLLPEPEPAPVRGPNRHERRKARKVKP